MKISQQIISQIKNGKIGVLPTDTLYGLIGQALKKKTVERIYKVRKRNPKKPFIILISSVRDLNLFGILLSSKEKKIFRAVWKKSVSVIIPCRREKFSYLHRGQHSLAFRLPVNPVLRRLIKKTGPLVAPSANPEGLIPAYTSNQAKEYFGNNVDFYVDEGFMKKKPSTIIRINGESFLLEREGAASRAFIDKIFK